MLIAKPPATSLIVTAAWPAITSADSMLSRTMRIGPGSTWGRISEIQT